MDLLGQGDDPFLITFADDAQGTAGLVDGGNRESGGLADAQAGPIDQAEANRRQASYP